MSHQSDIHRLAQLFIKAVTKGNWTLARHYHDCINVLKKQQEEFQNFARRNPNNDGPTWSRMWQDEARKQKQEQFTGGGSRFADKADGWSKYFNDTPQTKKPINLSKWDFQPVLEIREICLYSQKINDKPTLYIGTIQQDWPIIQLPENILTLVGVNRNQKVLTQTDVNKIVRYAINNALYFHPIEELI